LCCDAALKPSEAVIDEVTRHIWPDRRETWSLNVAVPMESLPAAEPETVATLLRRAA
jgi:hypothetical protein